jgi:hypothetical protein
MAFKLRSPLHTDNPYRAKSKAIVARHAKAVADYKPGSKANPTYGTAENIKEADLKEKGERTNLPLEKPKPTKKAKSNLPASQGGSPMAYRGDGKFNSANTNIKAADLLGQGPMAKGFRAIAGIDTPKSSFPSKITSTTGGASNLDFSKGDIIGQYNKGESKPSTTKPSSDGIMVRDAEKNNAERIKKTKPANNTSTNTNTRTNTNTQTNTISTGSNTNKDKSGGYLKDTKNFSLGVDTSMGGNISKVQNVVSKARDAGHNLISGGAMSKRDRIRNRQGVRTENKRTRVGQQIERIKGRQQRAGVSKDKGTNPGYSTEQKKLDAFESPKATTRTSGAGNIKANTTVPKLRTLKSNQTVAKPSMKLNTSVQTTGFIDDSKIKKGAKNAKGGKKVKASTYESLTGFKNKKGSSGGFRRGVSVANTSIKRNDLSKGPRA